MMKQKIIPFLTIFLLFFYAFSCQKKSEEKQKSKSPEQTEPEVEESQDKSKVSKPEATSDKEEKTVTPVDKLEVGKKAIADETKTGSTPPKVEKKKKTPPALKRSKRGLFGEDQKSPVALSSSITTFSGVNPNQIRQFMNKKNGECLQCYKQGNAEARVSETVEITFTFKPGGKISSCKINKPLENKKTAKCICKKAEQWNFPNLQKEISFKHRFRFNFAP